MNQLRRLLLLTVGLTSWALAQPAWSADAMAGMPPVSEPVAIQTADPAHLATTPQPTPTDSAADRFYSPAAMAMSRAMLRQEHGGMTYSKVTTNIAEGQVLRGGEGGYRWDVQADYGGDISRLAVKSEGDGSSRGGASSAEAQLLYSRAIGPYFNFQTGLRQDVEPRAESFVAVGVEGVLPYWFDVEASAFLGQAGDIRARLEGSRDLRVAQHLVLQARAELNLAATDMPAAGVGRGLDDSELGLRLRYEISPQFAPYAGVTYNRRFGRSAAYSRRGGGSAEDVSLVLGLRAWF